MTHDDALEAARAGDLTLLRMALATDPTLVEARYHRDVTLLHVAAEVDRADMCRVLIDAGADLEAETSWGHTALQWAGTLGSASAAAALLEAGAMGMNQWVAAGLGLLEEVEARTDADTLDHSFYLACRNGHLDVAELLLARGANLNAKGYFDATPLHWAAVNGQAEVVEWLVTRGADPGLRDPEFDGDAASWAVEGGHEDLAAQLRAWGARDDEAKPPQGDEA